MMRPTLRYAYSRNGEQGRVDEKCLVYVQIPRVDSADRGKVRYYVRVTNIRSAQVWESPHRFSEFLKLRNDLVQFFAKTDKKCPGCRNYEKVLKLFEFPRKHVFTSVTPAVINYRKKALCSFVALLASHTFTTTPKCPTCSGFPFTSVRDWLTTGVGDETRATNGSTEGSPTNEAIRDTLNVKDFTKYHPVSNAKPVDQEGRFVGSTSKYTPPDGSTIKQKENRHQRRRSSNPQPKERRGSSNPEPKEFSPRRNRKSKLRFDDDLPPSDSLSPPSVDELVLPAPTPIKSNHMSQDFENDIEGDQDFTSFVAHSVSSERGTNGYQPAYEPPSTDDSYASRTESMKKKPFKFTRNSIEAYNERLSMELRESSTIDFDDYEDEDEGLNMDFMNQK